MSKELTYAEVGNHGKKKDLYVVVHDKVYDVTGFVDEHPGGEEVLLDVAGGDATEAFEDVGHSDEARGILSGFQIGTLKRSPGDPVPNAVPVVERNGGSGTNTGFGIGLYVFILLGGAAAFGAYKYLQANSEQ